jgi:hypothetical protein
VVDSVAAKRCHEWRCDLRLADEFGESLGAIATVKGGDHGESLTSSYDIEPPQNRQL